MDPSRRDLLAAALAAPLAGAGAETMPARDGVRVVLLGTKGGPTPSPDRGAPATLIMVGGEAWLVDCGNGTARQLARAGIALPRVSNIFITHNHSDHVIDVGALIVLAWASGLAHALAVHGPPPLAAIVARSLAACEYDIAARIREEGRQRLLPLVRVRERNEAGLALESGGVRVTCALVNHYTVRPAFAYRFDTRERSIVISGDTTYSEALIALAKGADLLIHEAMYAEAITAFAPENAPLLRDHLLKSHTTTEQLGRIAAAAGVRKLVLTHLVPASPAITDAMWLAGVRRHYSGEAVVGRDLMEV
jgi:ribonuclease BN (tRNA processing enzyme)